MFYNRQHLFTWLCKNVTDRVLSTALDTGVVELLGGFKPLPTSNKPGWIVRVTSVYNTTYIIAVAVDRGKPYWFQVQDFSWCHYVGDTASNPLYQGDEPRVYKTLKWGKSL